jgi:hypothetical protein
MFRDAAARSVRFAHNEGNFFYLWQNFTQNKINVLNRDWMDYISFCLTVGYAWVNSFEHAGPDGFLFLFYARNITGKIPV